MHWRTLASRFWCVSSTPFGVPSEPLVKRTTAVSVNGVYCPANGLSFWFSNASSLLTAEILSPTSSR